MGAYFSEDSLLQTTAQFYTLSNYQPQIENASTNILNDKYRLRFLTIGESTQSTFTDIFIDTCCS